MSKRFIPRIVCAIRVVSSTGTPVKTGPLPIVWPGLGIWIPVTWFNLKGNGSNVLKDVLGLVDYL